ncbi:MAG TPA: ParB N-terminal domain-containing protein [Solirubrobacteraceae bacterium]|nr:ParB N-terminal domain-containing protein [Solirubrobacteraceae bacterium]
MSPSATPASQRIDEQDLRFDAHNPRIAGDDPGASQEELLLTLWRDFAVDELALSIAANGFFDHEPLFAAPQDGHFVVIEGNRRLAAVRLLRHRALRASVGATDLPVIGKRAVAMLETLPVIVAEREDVWQYVGFKHVNGPQVWRSHSKAQYIAWVHNDLKIPLEEIARQIGDKHRTVRRLYRALMVLDQAAEADVFHVEDRARKQFAFSHLYTGLDYHGFEKFLAINPERSYRPAPVPKSRLPQLGQLLVWLYGSKSRGEEPVIRSQNPDLRVLDSILTTRNGVAALERGLGLSVSHDISRGDDAIFRETLLAARQSLQEARGKLLTGYKGERDLKAVSEDIVELAQSIDAEMIERTRGRRAGARSTSR